MNKLKLLGLLLGIIGFLPTTAAVLDIKSKEHSTIDGMVDVDFSVGDVGTIERIDSIQIHSQNDFFSLESFTFSGNDFGNINLTYQQDSIPFHFIEGKLKIFFKD